MVLPAKAESLNELEQVLILFACTNTNTPTRTTTHTLTTICLQVVAGHYCTYGIQFDGLVVSFGDGGYGRLGHGNSDSQQIPRVISGLLGECTTITAEY